MIGFVSHRFYITNPSITILARPSSALASSLESTETSRVAAQRAALGSEGLAKVEKLLTEAKAEHERPIPETVLTDFKVPDVGRIGWLPVQSVKNEMGKKPASKGSLEEHVLADGEGLPFFLQFDHVKVGLSSLAPSAVLLTPRASSVVGLCHH